MNAKAFAFACARLEALRQGAYAYRHGAVSIQYNDGRWGINIAWSTLDIVETTTYFLDGQQVTRNELLLGIGRSL